MKFVIGLGNPGEQYTGTRHNVGFDVVAELAKRFATQRSSQKFQADFHEVMIGTQKTLLISPLTYMNRSGESVGQFVNFYKLPPEDVVVVCDDMNLPPGRLRWKPDGSAGGQNGIKNIIQHLGHADFPRLRIGIGRPPGKKDATSHVLGRFKPEELEELKLTILRAADSVEKWIDVGIEPTMNEFNRQVEQT